MNRISVFYEHMAEAMKQENITLDEVCAAVKRFGFDGVELDANRLKNEVGTILPALQKAGLSVNGIYNFFDFGSANGSPRQHGDTAHYTVLREDKLQVSACRAGLFDGGRNGARQCKV